MVFEFNNILLVLVNFWILLLYFILFREYLMVWWPLLLFPITKWFIQTFIFFTFSLAFFTELKDLYCQANDVIGLKVSIILDEVDESISGIDCI